MAADGCGIEAWLAAVIAKRGYLLPHHGLIAVALPGLRLADGKSRIGAPRA